MSEVKKQSRITPGRAAVYIVLGLFVLWFVIPIAFIMYRLSVYDPIAKQIAKEAKVEFPTADFTGIAAYDHDVIYFNVISGHETLDREALKNWLRSKRAEKKLGAKIVSRYPNEDHIHKPIDP